MSSFDFLRSAERAALHRETYTSVLKGLLAHGSAKTFAENTLGITPVYLSNLLDPDHAPPSPQLAHRIANALPLDADQRSGLLEHMLLAREEADRSVALLGQRDARSVEDMGATHTALRQVYDESNLTNASDQAQQSIQSVHEMGKILLHRLNAEAMPLIFVEICLIIHAAQMALNRWDDALYLTLEADAVLQCTDPADVAVDIRWLHHLQINVLYAQAITYRNLNLPRQAELSLQRIMPLLKFMTDEQRRFWLPHVYRDRIAVLWQMPRFALSEVEGIADAVRTMVQKRADPADAVLLMLIDRALVDAWTRYDSPRSLKQAGRLLQTRLDGLADVPGAGPMQRTMFLRSAIRYFWRREQVDEWRHFTALLMQTASHAGLRHQLSEVKREYGDALEGIKTL